LPIKNIAVTTSSKESLSQNVLSYSEYPGEMKRVDTTSTPVTESNSTPPSDHTREDADSTPQFGLENSNSWLSNKSSKTPSPLSQWEVAKVVPTLTQREKLTVMSRASANPS
jgi:hypothetical protein